MPYHMLAYQGQRVCFFWSVTDYIIFLCLKKQARAVANIFHKSIGPAFLTLKEKGGVGDGIGTLKGKLERFVVSTLGHRFTCLLLNCLFFTMKYIL